MFNFPRSCQTVFQNDSIILNYYQQGMRVPTAIVFPAATAFSCFKMNSIYICCSYIYVCVFSYLYIHIYMDFVLFWSKSPVNFDCYCIESAFWILMNKCTTDVFRPDRMMSLSFVESYQSKSFHQLSSLGEVKVHFWLVSIMCPFSGLWLWKWMCSYYKLQLEFLSWTPGKVRFQHLCRKYSQIL